MGKTQLCFTLLSSVIPTRIWSFFIESTTAACAMSGLRCGRFVAMAMLISVCSARTSISSPAATPEEFDGKFASALDCSGGAVETAQIMVAIKDVLKEMTSVLTSINAKMDPREFEAHNQVTEQTTARVQGDESLQRKLSGGTRLSFPNSPF